MSKQELETRAVLDQLRKVASAQRVAKRTKVYFGANACLRALRAGKVVLCIIPLKQSAALVDQFLLTAKGKCDLIWSPEISPKDLGNVLGLPNTCAMAAFPQPSSLENENQDDDLIVSVRRAIEDLLVINKQQAVIPPPKMQRLSCSSTSSQK